MARKSTKKELTQLAQTAINSDSDRYDINTENLFLSTNPSKRKSLKGFFNLTGTDTAMTHQITLLDCGGDLTKSWRISFYIYSNAKKKTIKKFLRVPAKLKTEKARRTWADQAIEKIKFEITNGKTLDDVPEPAIVHKRIPSLKEAIREAVDFKKRKTPNERTHEAYNFFEKKILEWSDDRQMSHHDVNKFTEDHAFDLLRHIDQGISPRTYNNYLIYFKSIWNAIAKRKHINDNPFKEMEKKPVPDTDKVPFNPDQKLRILEAIRDLKTSSHNTQMHLWFVKFIYYSFMRPTEIVKIQIFDIKSDKILVAGSDSKTLRTDYIIITPGIKALLEEMEAAKANPSGYLFAMDGVGGFWKMQDNYISKYHTPILRDLDIQSPFTLYSWKDTGMCDTYIATRDLVFVSRQARHSDVNMTMTYFRKQGLLSDMITAALQPLLPI